MKKHKQNKNINLINPNKQFIGGNYQISSTNKKHSGVYVIIINNKIYVGESFDIQNRWEKHKQDLINNIHSNTMLQQEFNKSGTLKNTYFIPLYHTSFTYVANMLTDDSYNVLKLILIILEHLVIDYFRNQQTYYICCNKENTLSKIYRLANKQEKIYIKQCYNTCKKILQEKYYNKLINNIIPLYINNNIIVMFMKTINILNDIPILDYKNYKSNNIKDYYK